MAARVKSLFFVLLVEEIRANLMCTVSVYQNQSADYIISGPPPAPDCSHQWTADNTVLVDEMGNIYHQVVLRSEPHRILTKGCQRDVAYHLECLSLLVFTVVKCNHKCAVVSECEKVTHTNTFIDTPMVKLPGTGRTHVVTYAVIGIAVLLGFVMTVITYKYRHLRESYGAV